MPVISEVTHHLALLPLLWLAILHHSGKQRRAIWWLFAVLLAVSWVADTAAHWVDPWLVSALYPVAQVAVVSISLPQKSGRKLILSVLSIALATVAFRGLGRPDVFVRTICWVSIMLIFWPSPLRTTALTSFGLCWLAWIGYSIIPSWTSWGIYQGLRATGTGLFCYESARA